MMEKTPIETIQVKEEFQIFPKNTEEVINAIKEDMEANGFDEASPIVLWNDVVIDGHTRLEIAKELGIEEAPCIVYEFEDDDQAIEYALHMQRDRRNLEDDELYYVFEKIDRRKERGGDHGNQYTKEERQSTDFGTLTNKKSYEDTAKKLGIGKTKVQEMRTIQDHADDETKEAVKSGEKKIHQAYEKTQEKRREQKTKEERKEDFTKTEDGFYIGKRSKKPKSTFNKQTNESIEWAKWSWNPVTGCKHGCKYCYARDIANRFNATGFVPTFHPDRLVGPQQTKIPEDRLDEEGINTVFVCSMADLFGDWVPPEWIEDVLQSVKEAPEWNFIFLTKNPKRYTGIEWPENAWVGTTVDTQNRVEQAIDAFSQIEATVKFLSCEPLKEHLQFNAEEHDVKGEWLSVFNWIIIGGQSDSSGEPAQQPKWEWVWSLYTQARNSGCSIYWKPNLTVRPKEYPKI